MLGSFKCRVPCGPFARFTSLRVRIRLPQSERQAGKEGLAGRRGASARRRGSISGRAAKYWTTMSRLANDERLRQQMSSTAEERRIAFESAVFDGHVGRHVQEPLRWIATPPRRG
jgi:hypothetical protein